MYSYFKVEVGAASDSSLYDPVFGPRKVFLEQTKDQQDFVTVIRVGPAAAEAIVPMAPVVNGYRIYVASDYPVKLRLNGVSATQYILTSNNVAATNVGAPLPDACIFIATCSITSVYLAPITSAAQTANVKIFISGDPISAYI